MILLFLIFLLAKSALLESKSPGGVPIICST